MKIYDKRIVCVCVCVRYTKELSDDECEAWRWFVVNITWPWTSPILSSSPTINVSISRTFAQQKKRTQSRDTKRDSVTCCFCCSTQSAIGKENSDVYKHHRGGKKQFKSQHVSKTLNYSIYASLKLLINASQCRRSWKSVPKSKSESIKLWRRNFVSSSMVQREKPKSAFRVVKNSRREMLSAHGRSEALHRARVQ